MKCKNCKKENSEEDKYCKYCGEILYEINTCQNGHQYNATEINCPYCPTPGGQRIINPFNDDATEVDDSREDKTDKTKVDISKAKLKPNNSNCDDRTVISPPNPNPDVGKPNSSRKLIGWLVTFDIDKNGKDFRLYEGRTTIGKNNKNDIVLLDNTVSFFHSTILYRPIDKKLIIQDNLSTNGTFVNDTLINDKCILADNDIIRIGRINLKVKLI